VHILTLGVLFNVMLPCCMASLFYSYKDVCTSCQLILGICLLMDSADIEFIEIIPFRYLDRLINCVNIRAGCRRGVLVLNICVAQGNQSQVLLQLMRGDVYILYDAIFPPSLINDDSSSLMVQELFHRWRCTITCIFIG